MLTSRRSMTVGAVLLTLVPTASGCSSTSAPPGQLTDSSVVSATPSTNTNGSVVTRAVGGIRVTATTSGGAPDPGGALVMTVAADPGKAFDAQVASSPAVKLTLGSGTQPQKPITLQFDLSGQPALAAQFNDTVKPVVRSVADSDSSVTDLLATQWDPSSKTVTATTTHLSIFQVIAADLGAVAKAATAAWRQAVGRPDSSCADKSELTIAGTKYTLTPSMPSGPVAGCLRDTSGAVGIDFVNGTKQYYRVASTPPGEFSNPDMLNSTDVITVWLQQSNDSPSGLLTPKASGQLKLPAGTTSGTIRLDVSPVTLQLKTLLTALDMLGVDNDVLSQTFQSSRAAWDCVTTAHSSVTQPDEPTVDEFRNALGDIGQCGLAGAEAAKGAADKTQVLHRMSVAISLLTTLPDQLLANITGAIGEATGDNHLEFALTSEAPTTAAPASSSTLQPLIIKTHGSPADSGEELGPNHFRLGHILKDHGSLYVSLKLRWKTGDGKGVASYCNERSQVLDSAGNTVLQRQQRLAVCDNGGNWSFNITSPGTYTYVLDVDREGSDSLHAEQQFTVDS